MVGISKKNIERFKISISPILRTLVFSLLVFLSLGPIILAELMKQSNNPVIIYSLGLVIGIVLIPAIAMSINYIIANSGQKLIINHARNELVIVTKNDKEKIKDSDIDRILIFGQRDSNEKQLFRTAWNEFHYYKIVLKDKREFSISSFMIFDLEKRYTVDRYKYEYKFFPFIEI